MNCWKIFPEGPSSAPSTGGSAGSSRVVTPDSPFPVEDLSSDSVFYVQDGQRNAPASKDVFSFYISDGHSQTEAFSVEIDIQVRDLVSRITDSDSLCRRCSAWGSVTCFPASLSAE